MWTSSLLKQNAKNNMQSYFWSAVGLLIIMGVISGAVSYISSLVPTFFLGVTAGFSDLDSAMEDLDNPLVWIYYLVTILISFAITIFVTGILEIGKCRYFIHARQGDSDFGNLFWAFQGGRYIPCVKTVFQRLLEIFLYTLLLIIPGYIKMFEYVLVPYLLAENPNLEPKRALEISRQTMQGEKLKYAIMGLSFIGWVFLSIFTCYLGFIYVAPYMQATDTEFYACMRAKMLATGITTEEELTDYASFSAFNSGYPQNTPFNPPYPPQNPNPYDTQNPYQSQNPYQNPSPYQPQNPYQNPNPYQPDNTPNPNEMPNVNLDKNPYDTQNSDFNQPDAPSAPDSRPHVNLDKNPYDDNQNNQF